MPSERTLSIVKPDGVGRNLIGEVYRRFEQAGLRIIAARMMQLSQAEAEGFFARHREIRGPPDPKKADKGKIRADLAGSIDENVVHGSDATETAGREIAYFF